MDASRRFVTVATLVIGLGMVGAGAWAWVDPHSFAEFAAFPVHVHFLHDLGAFQIGLGVTLLLALIWRDALSTVLAGFLVGNTIHALNHALDLDLGGQPRDAWLLAAVSIIVAVVLWLRPVAAR